MVGKDKYVVPIESESQLRDYFRADGKMTLHSDSMAVITTALRKKFVMKGLSTLVIRGRGRKLETVSLGGGLWEIKLLEKEVEYTVQSRPDIIDRTLGV